MHDPISCQRTSGLAIARQICHSMPMGPKILVVEDDPYIRESIQELLELESYTVACAANGKEALDYLEKIGNGLPQLILLDLMMPVMDGFEFRRQQVTSPVLSKIPLIVMSAD